MFRYCPKQSVLFFISLLCCFQILEINVDSSGVARVAELGGQAGSKGLFQGGKHIREARTASAISAGGQRAAQGPQKLTEFR